MSGQETVELYEHSTAYGVCETTISEDYVVVGRWNGSATVNVSLKDGEVFTCFTNYEMKSLEEFKDAFVDFVLIELSEGRFNVSRRTHDAWSA